MKLTLVINNPAQLLHGYLPLHRFGPQGGSIGSAAADWCLEDRHNSVQPNHCEIRVVEGRFCVIDRSGSTYANGHDLPLGRNVAVSLNDGDLLQIGAYRVAVQFGEHAPGQRSLDELFSAQPEDMQAWHLEDLPRLPLPDGSVFDIPHDLAPPAPLEIADSSAVNQIVYLALPLRSNGALEVRWPDRYGNSRYIARREEIRDTHSDDGDQVGMDLAVPNLQLMLERSDRSAFTGIAIGRIKDKRPDGSLVMDEHFYPTSLSLQAVPALHRYLGEVAGLMRERAKNLAQRIGSPGQSGVADVTDFNLLQTLNRLFPLFQHLARQRQVHPERLYIALAQACGELVTFTDEGHLPEEYPAYQHDNLRESFQLLEHTLRRTLGTVLQPRAVSLPIVTQQYGVRTAALNDKRLLDNAEFILAVRAELPAETLRQQLPKQIKISSTEGLEQLVSLQLPGIPLLPLPVAPRHLPFHAGFSYFELDRHHPTWQSLSSGSGFGFHIAGEFPELELQFWAITFTHPRYNQQHTATGDQDLNNQHKDYERYDYPGRYKRDIAGKPFTKTRLAALRSDAKLAHLEGDDERLQPGLAFDLNDHPREDFNDRWRTIAIKHEGKQHTSLQEEAFGSGHGTSYSLKASAIRWTSEWKAPLRDKPCIDGPQIATVVGPPGEEIYCDEWGRVKVQFPWDRSDKNNDQSSCWIRVAQGWAGATWGAMAVPRVNQELIISFLDGDPDQPIATGRTYRETNLPPYELPKHKTRMTIKSRTHKGSGFNELRFEDELGQQEVFIHAEKDKNVHIKNNNGIFVGNDRKERVDHNETVSIGDHRTEDVGQNETIQIGANRSVTIGGNKAETIKLAKAESIGLAKALTIGAAYQTSVGAAMNTTVGLSQSEQVGIHKSVVVGKRFSIDAGDEFKIKVGKSTLVMKSDGSVLINGRTFDFTASGAVQINGKDVDIN